MNAIEKYDARAAEVNSLLCVGLDSDLNRLPQQFQQADSPQFAFNHWIIEQTHPFASAYKLNTAFYEALGDQGWVALKRTVDYLRSEHPHILTICDAKRADIGTTNAGYVHAIFDWLAFDSVTLQPYLGQEALSPFLERADKGCIILCRTSNPGAGELQDLLIGTKPLWQIVAEKVSGVWNTRGNCMLVVGATYPTELHTVRTLIGAMPLLVPGIGAQGGEIRLTVEGGVNADGRGLIVNSSRGIIFADNPYDAAKTLRDALNQYR